MSNVREEYLKRQALRNAPAWMPEPGTTVRAKCIGLRMGDSDYGRYPIVVYSIRTDDGKDTGDIMAVHAFHSVLANRLAELKTDVGSDQWLSYLGTRQHRTEVDKKTGEPKEYHMYDVENFGEKVTVKEEGFTFELPTRRD